jgi:hypothetical protein
MPHCRQPVLARRRIKVNTLTSVYSPISSSYGNTLVASRDARSLHSRLPKFRNHLISEDFGLGPAHWRRSLNGQTLRMVLPFLWPMSMVSSVAVQETHLYVFVSEFCSEIDLHAVVAGKVPQRHLVQNFTLIT